MQLFIVFILGAVLLGAGSMLSPAWKTAQPRIGLAATLCLALVVGGAVFYASAFGWDTLVVDYLLFALLSGVVLGGTLSSAQARAEAKGETLSDSEQGWPGPQDLAFFAIVAVIILIPLVNIVAPLGTQGQILGFHTLTTRFGESFTSLAPYYPEQIVIVSPGFHALTAYLSQQLEQPIPMIQMSVTAVVLYLCVWLAYDIGAELENKRLGRAMAVALLLCGGVFISYLDGHFTEIMGLLFTLAFLMYALRMIREFSWADMVAGGLMMGAVVYTNLTMSIVLILGFIPLCVLVWLTPQSERSSAQLSKSRLGLTLGFPIVMLIGIAPWLLRNLELFFPIVPSPYSSDIGLLSVMILGQGILIVPLAMWGMVVGLRKTENRERRMLSIVMMVWLILVIEFSLFGIIGSIFPFIGDLIHPANLARHGVIVPFMFLGGLAILSLWENALPNPLQSNLRNRAYMLIAGVAVVIIGIGLSFNTIIDVVRPVLGLPNATISSDEVAVMTWIQENTPDDAQVYAIDNSGWLPVYTERYAPDFRANRYFEWGMLTTGDDMPEFDMDAVPYDYVYTPVSFDVTFDDSDTLVLLFEQGGARVYEVVKTD